jgi:hypothetical protein
MAVLYTGKNTFYATSEDIVRCNITLLLNKNEIQLVQMYTEKNSTLQRIVKCNTIRYNRVLYCISVYSMCTYCIMYILYLLSNKFF